jgi:hypothetical protein
VVFIRLGSKLNFFYFDLSLCPARITFFFRFLVYKFAKIHHPANRRVRIWGNLHQVEVGFMSYTQGILNGYDADVFAVWTN